MDLKNLTALIERIETLPEDKTCLQAFTSLDADIRNAFTTVETFNKFKQDIKENECGTFACIAGHACCIAPFTFNQGLWANGIPIQKVNYVDTAEYFLGINIQSIDLFSSRRRWEEVVFKTDKAIALARLNHLKANGEFDQFIFEMQYEDDYIVELEKLRPADS